MEENTRRRALGRRLAVLAAIVVAALVLGRLLIAHADGPFFIFAGGPFRSGERLDYANMDWEALDDRTELEMEIVGAATSITLWFSVYDGVPYVACDLDCMGGRLERWPQQIARDDRVVVRLDGKRVEGRLVHVPHGTDEYVAVRAGRERKYSGEDGVRAAAETAAHDTVVEVGEVLTGRARREEPGDRLYRVDPRPGEG
ncbi:MAG: hypothetical protein H6748_03765 [Spirochaetaceae bacterium]|nr:hypothetical protein [Myxococcales bacterium]MCB9723148.1 hypothetical protein [Spirochaetaceae bacterium]